MRGRINRHGPRRSGRADTAWLASLHLELQSSDNVHINPSYPTTDIDGWLLFAHANTRLPSVWQLEPHTLSAGSTTQLCSRRIRMTSCHHGRPIPTAAPAATAALSWRLEIAIDGFAAQRLVTFFSIYGLGPAKHNVVLDQVSPPATTRHLRTRCATINSGWANALAEHE